MLKGTYLARMAWPGAVALCGACSSDRLPDGNLSQPDVTAASEPSVSLQMEPLAAGARFSAPRNGARWTWELTLARYGCEGQSSAVPQGEHRASGQRTHLIHLTGLGTVDQWFEPAKDAIEHGFNLPAHPGCDGRVVLGLRSGGNLSPTATRDGRSVLLHDQRGRTVLEYRDLKVFDATGRSLEASMRVAGNELSIAFDPAGASWPVVIDPLVASTESTIVKTSPFGHHVAVSGDTAVIGEANQAQVYVRSGATWTAHQSLKPTGLGTGFGSAFSLALEGTTLVVGSPTVSGCNPDECTGDWACCNGVCVNTEVDDANCGVCGKACVGSCYKGACHGSLLCIGCTAPYVCCSSSCVLPEADEQHCGACGKFCESGRICYRGACMLRPYSNDTGAAFVFQLQNGAWSQTQILTPPDAPAHSDHLFGTEVALSGDYLVVGSAQDSKAHVFARSGARWVHEQSLGNWKPQSSCGDSSPSPSLAISGTTILLGGSASATVYVRKVGTWVTEATLKPSTQSCAGSSVALSGDLAVIADPEKSTVYTFKRSGTTWTQGTTLTGTDDLGDRLALAGELLVAGPAPTVYVRNGSNWVQEAALGAPSASWLAIDRDTVAVGSDDKGTARLLRLGLADGSPCTPLSAPLCDSNQCADGVCCNTACTGPCQACSSSAKGGGIDGVCDFVVDGIDPSSECPDVGVNECRADGVCDGGGQCRTSVIGKICKASSCNLETEQFNAWLCNHAGTCLDMGKASCGTYKCDPSLGACRTSCTSSDQCSGGLECLLGKCGTGKNNGETCTTDAECSSLHCVVEPGVQSRCCDSECTGSCVSCLMDRKANGTADGTCGFVKPGTDPKDGCPASASLCGSKGACDGQGACLGNAPQGASCGAASCAGGMRTESLCDGSGACLETTNTCNGYKCSPLGNDCLVSCTDSSDCAVDYFCKTSACLLRKANGEKCTLAQECASDRCVDSVCCDGDCDQPCHSCSGNANQTGEDGICGPVKAGTVDPRGVCKKSTENPCGESGKCTDDGQCGVEPLAQPCGQPACASGVASTFACDGYGACQEATTPCSPWACDSSTRACKKSCATADDCAPGARCNVQTSQCAAQGSSCKDDFTVLNADGTETGCSPYRCQTGACRDSCTTSNDCASGFICTNDRCVLAPTDAGAGSDAAEAGSGTVSVSSQSESGCGCATPGRSPATASASLLLAFLALARPRRRSRKPAAARAARNQLTIILPTFAVVLCASCNKSNEVNVDQGTGGSTNNGASLATCDDGVSPGAQGPTMLHVGKLDGACFWMDETEVSRAQYGEFLAATSSGAADGFNLDVCKGHNDSFQVNASVDLADGTRPVGGVDWCDAAAFCKWAGKRLCGTYESAGLTVSEFESVCTNGTDGSFRSSEEFALAKGTCQGGASGPATVNGMPACITPTEIQNLVGNVKEWTAECDGPGHDAQCRFRGGSYQCTSSSPETWGCAGKASLARSKAFDDLGFRCCAD